MIYFLMGLALLGLVLYFLKAFSRADPQSLAKKIRIAGGVFCLVLAFILTLRGAYILSIPIGTFGLGLLGWRPASGGGWHPRGRASTALSEKEALEILGLQRGATKKEILKAHRDKMKENHPDRGGSEEEAKKINAAKDLLIGNKR